MSLWWCLNLGSLLPGWRLNSVALFSRALLLAMPRSLFASSAETFFFKPHCLNLFLYAFSLHEWSANRVEYKIVAGRRPTLRRSRSSFSLSL